jgi:hypothetical protein
MVEQDDILGDTPGRDPQDDRHNVRERKVEISILTEDEARTKQCPFAPLTAAPRRE